MPGVRKPNMPIMRICTYCHIYTSRDCVFCGGKGWFLHASPIHRMVYRWQCRVGLGDSKHGQVDRTEVDISDLVASDHPVGKEG